MKKSKIKTKGIAKNQDTSAYVDHMDFRALPELSDDGLANYLKGVCGINMLDLNETEITNESITLLSKLEYVYELRMKDCVEVDNNCIEDLNKITSLRFLYIKDTKITIDGLLQLKNLTNLTKLLFSDDKTYGFEEKMLALKQILPNCDFVVNTVPYIF